MMKISIISRKRRNKYVSNIKKKEEIKMVSLFNRSIENFKSKEQNFITDNIKK